MNYAAIIAGLALPRLSADAATKRDVLAGLVGAVLARHDAAFGLPGRVATEIDLRTLGGASEADQRAAMGTPARYAEVLWRGSSSEGAEMLHGGAATASHTFLVSVYYGAGTGSEAAFTALLESLDPAAPGLLAALRAVGSVVTDDRDVIEVDAPTDVRILFTPARPNASGLGRYQHEAAFLISLT